MIEAIRLHFEAQRPNAASVSESGESWVAKKATTPVFSARSLAPVVQTEARDPLTEESPGRQARVLAAGQLGLKLQDDKFASSYEPDDGGGEQLVPSSCGA